MDVVSIGETMVLFTPQTTGQMRYAKQYSSKIAGAETNTLIGLAKLGHQVGWISKLGDDEFGESILSFVRGEGVDVSQVNKTSNASTGLFFKEIENEKSVNIYYYRKNSAASLLASQDIDDSYIQNSKFLYITGITPALSETCREMIFHAIEVAKKADVQVIFDPNLRRNLWSEDEARKTLLELSKRSDIVLPGINEGKFLFNQTDYHEITKSFHELGAHTVVVKLGEEGAYYSSNGISNKIPSFQINRVVDPVGAGDGFAAGFISGLLEGLSLDESVEKACVIGAIVTTVSGDVEGLPDQKSLKKLQDSLNSEDVHR